MYVADLEFTLPTLIIRGSTGEFVCQSAAVLILGGGSGKVPMMLARLRPLLASGSPTHMCGLTNCLFAMRSARFCK